MIGHGSREESFAAAMERTASRLRGEGRFNDVLCAYLEITPPSIEESVARCVEKKISEVRLLPYFLLTGRHVTADIPAIAAKMKTKYKGVLKIILCPYLGYDEKIVSLVRKRIGEGR